MVRNIVILSGNSHQELSESVCNTLGVPLGNRILAKFSGGESRCEIKDSVRGKDVFIIQSGGGAVNDNLMELCIMISACKTGSAKKVTAVLPLFPYSRQPDLPYKKTGAPLASSIGDLPTGAYTFESVPATPGPGIPKSIGLTSTTELSKMFSKTLINPTPRSNNAEGAEVRTHSSSISSQPGNFTSHDYFDTVPPAVGTFEPKTGYKRWVAQAGTLVADLLTCAGADQ
jgi:ribose-phosphate pyrophosphokinase